MDPNPLTSIHLSANQVEIIAFSLLLARCPDSSQLEKGKANISQTLGSRGKLESMLFRGSSRKFYKVWQPFLSVVESLWDTIS